MDKILHDPKDPKLWELWYIPYNGKCRILSINSMAWVADLESQRPNTSCNPVQTHISSGFRV